MATRRRSRSKSSPGLFGWLLGGLFPSQHYTQAARHYRDQEQQRHARAQTQRQREREAEARRRERERAQELRRQERGDAQERRRREREDAAAYKRQVAEERAARRRRPREDEDPERKLAGRYFGNPARRRPPRPHPAGHPLTVAALALQHTRRNPSCGGPLDTPGEQRAGAESQEFHGASIANPVWCLHGTPEVVIGKLKSLQYVAPHDSRRAGLWEHVAGDTLSGPRHGGQSLVVADPATGQVTLTGEKFMADRGLSGVPG